MIDAILFLVQPPGSWHPLGLEVLELPSHVGHLDQGCHQSKCDEEKIQTTVCDPSSNSGLFCPHRPADWSKTKSQNWVKSEGRAGRFFALTELGWMNSADFLSGVPS